MQKSFATYYEKLESLFMIETHQLSKQYGSVTALHPLDLEIAPQEIFGYVGPNGSGKTTTIRMLCGLLTPSSGAATVAGVDITTDAAKVRSSIGFMPDHLVPYDGMRVWEYLDFFGAAYRIGRRQRKKRTQEVLELTGSSALQDYFVETLSHGMRQRLGVARALIHDPDVLFLDEPTNGLDPRARVEMRLLLDRLKQQGKTILISSHILHELALMCDRVGFIEQGKLLVCGTVDTVQRTVHPDRIFEIEVLHNAESVENAIAQILEPSKLVSISRLENLIRVEMKINRAEISDLLSDLVKQGHSIIGFRELQADLEEAFMALTADVEFGTRSNE